MIRVLALAHMVSENHVSSKLLYALCGNDHTYFDLLNTLPQARPLDNDVRSLVSARLKAGVKPAYIREADGWDYTNQQMYRMKKDIRMPGAYFYGRYPAHPQGWYPDMAKLFYTNCLRPLQLPHVYRKMDGVGRECKLYVIQGFRMSAPFIRWMYSDPELAKFYEEMKELPHLRPGHLKEYPRENSFYKMLNLASNNGPYAYQQYDITYEYTDLMNKYAETIDQIYLDIISLQGQGFFNDDLMMQGGDCFGLV